MGEAEQRVLERLHAAMTQNGEVRAHAVATLAAQGRMAELLLLPPQFHAALQAHLHVREGFGGGVRRNTWS